MKRMASYPSGTQAPLSRQITGRLDHPANLLVPADHRVQLPIFRVGHQVAAVLQERLMGLHMMCINMYAYKVGEGPEGHKQ